MIQNSPEQASLLLNQNPQLAFGVFQALISMNLVDAYSMQVNYIAIAPNIN